MVRQAFFWTLSAQLVAFCVSFAASIVVARLLTPYELGIYTVAVATVAILQTFASFGVSNYIIKAQVADRDVLDTAFTVNLVLALVLSAIILTVSDLGGRFLQDPAVAAVLRVLAPIPLIAALEFRPSAMLQRAMLFRPIALILTAQVVIGAGVTVTSAWLGAHYMSPAYGALAASCVSALGYLMVGRRYVSFRMSASGWRPIVSFGLQMISIAGVSSIGVRLADIVLARSLGLAALGLFGRASSLSMLLFQNVYGAATKVLFSRLSQEFRETGQYRATYMRGLRTIATAMGPILIGLAVLSGPVILNLFGPRWLAAAAPLSIVLVAQFITLRYAMSWELFAIRDDLRSQTRIQIAITVVGFISRAVASTIGLIAFAAASVVEGVFAVLIYRRPVNRMIGADEREMLRISGETLALTALAVAPAIVVMMLNRWNPHTSLLAIALGMATGAMLWLTALRAIAHPLFAEVMLVARALRLPGIGRLEAGRDLAGIGSGKAE